MSTIIQRKRLMTDVARELRAVTEEWDDRCGQAFDELTSEERAAIHGKREECLTNAGLLMIEAIIEFGWRPGNRESRMVPRAHGARRLEEDEPYKQGALKFLRELVAWYYRNPAWCPPGFPEHDPLKMKRSIFSVENVPGEELREILCVIADLLEATSPELTSDDESPADNSGGSQGPDRRHGWERLEIIRSDTGNDLAQLDSCEFRLRGEADAAFLECLKARRGEPILASALQVQSGERPDRIFERLPEPIQRIIDKPGQRTGKKGYRML